MAFTAPEWPAFGESDYQLNAIVGQRHFDFWAWHFRAYLDKGEALLASSPLYLDGQQQQMVVLDYLAQIERAQQLEREIEAIYTNPEVAHPDVANPDEASLSLQQELATTREAIGAAQNVAEGIVQGQVTAVLQAEGFSLIGAAWPPVLMKMSPLPSLLIVSPRDRIERVEGVSLENGVSVPERDRLETAVLTQLNQAALVVPIGGLGTYPAMIAETSSINWLVEVTAHEWTHHWLGLKPLGINYLTNSELRTINETVASIVDVEIAEKVIAHYYPDFVPSPPAPPSHSPATNDEPAPFDFRAEMAATRVRVDELLAQGEIEAAEQYMEGRRRLFVENGFAIRKLNQAYFAFYGAYAAQPGATGSDPVGPLVRKVRENSPSLRHFLDSMAPITSLAELEVLAGE